jgi:superfamily I DNA/RNA helicase
MNQIAYINESQFRESMLRLRRLGGDNGRAYNEACRLLSSLSLGANELNKLTKHGETRIDHCVKYDISGSAHRLVTVQTDNFIYVLFVGTHEDTEHWLDQNRGLTITCNPDTKKVVVTHVTHDHRRDIPQLNYAKLTEENAPYFKRLGADISHLIPNRLLLRTINTVDDNTTEDELDELLEALTDFDKDVANLMLDLIFELREGNIEGANARLEQFEKKAVAIQDDPGLEQVAINDIANADNVALLTGLTQEQLQDLFAPEKFQEWMLFLNPDQKRIAEVDSDRTLILTGVSGSGKTCVLVHRARYLARKYPDKRIGVLTLNRSLSRLISHLLDALCTSEERHNIHAMAFYDYFEILLREFGPDKELEQLRELADDHQSGGHIKQTIDAVDRKTYAREYDPISGENLEDTWELFLDQPTVRTLRTYFGEHLWKYDKWVDPDRYLREEFSLLRSAVTTSNRVAGYKELMRTGRSIPLTESIRQHVLDLLLLYEETMISGGILDELALTLALVPHLKEFRNLPPDKRFHCLLIDEFQDFSTRDLALLRLIPTSRENGLFLTGDTVQRVLVKDLRLGAVGMDVTSARWERITKNYRNSRQILQTAALLANQYGAEAKTQGEEIEVLDPQLAVRETCAPKAIRCAKNAEIEQAWKFAAEALNIQSALPWSVCIITACPDDISIDQIVANAPSDLKIKVGHITGDYTRSKDTLSVGTMSDVKGFEFSQVIILGCGEKTLPPKGTAIKEEWREALRLYVAMTRARDEVRLIYSGKPSKFLHTMRDELVWQETKPETVQLS